MQLPRSCASSSRAATSAAMPNGAVANWTSMQPQKTSACQPLACSTRGGCGYAPRQLATAGHVQAYHMLTSSVSTVEPATHLWGHAPLPD